MNNAQKNAQNAAPEELGRMVFPGEFSATFAQSASVHLAASGSLQGSVQPFGENLFSIVALSNNFLLSIDVPQAGYARNFVLISQPHQP